MLKLEKVAIARHCNWRPPGTPERPLTEKFSYPKRVLDPI